MGVLVENRKDVKADMGAEVDDGEGSFQPKREMTSERSETMSASQSVKRFSVSGVCFWVMTVLWPQTLWFTGANCQVRGDR